MQFHFHSPSEHEMEGFLYPLEMHLVHKDGDGNLAVIGLMFKEGRPNAFLQTFWNHLPQKPGESKRLATVTVATSLVFPKNLEFYRYSGSLTTPPCSE
ncbi:MAG: carbonic anhydrase family protein, partial [Sphingobacteriales bacterium]|nr:carbonic anhydrase family protein [Sphingobacteriales bacterium]